MMEYGLRWREYTKAGDFVTKEKFFNSEEQRAKFAKRLSEKEAFHEFVAWSDLTIH